MITGVITGDIIKSRGQKNPDIWLNTLRNALSYLCPDEKYWIIYRGDSFQLEINNFSESFKYATYLKACIKSIHGLDVRLAIGIGNKTYDGQSVSESNGEAFVFSGEALEKTKKEKQNLLIKTNRSQMDFELNLYFRLILIALDNWTVKAAEIVKLSIENPNTLQSELGEIIGINQNAVSTRQKRAYLDEILALDNMFKEKVAIFLI